MFGNWVDKNREFYLFGLGFIVASLFLVLQLFIFTRPSIEGVTDFLALEKSNELGDAIGGLTSPFIGLLSCGLVFLAFRQQLIANNILSSRGNVDNIINNLYRLQDKFDSQLELDCRLLSGYFNSPTQYDGIIDVKKILRKLNLIVYNLSFLWTEIKENNNSEYLRKLFSFTYYSTFKAELDELVSAMDNFRKKNDDFIDLEVRDFYVRLLHITSLNLER